MKKFELKFSHIINKKEKELYYHFVLYINGKPINEKHLLDLYGILNYAIMSDRDFTYFWNCDCGEPGCANIEPVNIKNDFLILPNPCSTNDFKEKSYDYWLKNHKKEICKISKKDVAKILWDFCDQIHEDMKLKKERLMSWPTITNYGEFEWPINLPFEIQSLLLKNGFDFRLD